MITKCKLCTSSLSCHGKLKHHYHTTHSFDFTCHLCSEKRPIDRFSLLEHLKKQHGLERSFMCTCCHWMFRSGVDARRHEAEMTETGKPRHVAPVATFEPKHQMVNDPPKQSEDVKSDSTSSQPTESKSHNESTSSKTEEPTTSSRESFTCDCCNWNFASTEDLLSHLKSMLSTGTPGETQPISKGVRQLELIAPSTSQLALPFGQMTSADSTTYPVAGNAENMKTSSMMPPPPPPIPPPSFPNPPMFPAFYPPLGAPMSNGFPFFFPPPPMMPPPFFPSINYYQMMMNNASVLTPPPPVTANATSSEDVVIVPKSDDENGPKIDSAQSSFKITNLLEESLNRKANKRLPLDELCLGQLKKKN